MLKRKEIKCKKCNKSCYTGKRSLCDKCYGLELKAKEKLKVKKEKIIIKKKEKSELITEKKLDTIFSKLVRILYDDFCKACNKPITFSTSHNAHLISRTYRCVRWDLRNCYNTCPSCNLYDQTHVIFLAKRLKEYYNIEIEDWIKESKSTCKLNSKDRKRLYDVFDEYYNNINDGNIVLKSKSDRINLANDILLKTKLIK